MAGPPESLRRPSSASLSSAPLISGGDAPRTEAPSGLRARAAGSVRPILLCSRLRSGTAGGGEESGRQKKGWMLLQWRFGPGGGAAELQTSEQRL